MQTEYNQKILDSAKQAIDAYEINTTQLNAEFSTHPDSQRRDVMAAINTFVTSLANTIGISGTSEEVLQYVPAVAFTMYDGFYIYSPAEVANTITDEDGVTVVMTESLSKSEAISGSYSYNSAHEGKVLYKCASGSGMRFI